jgi:tetratricopeptide (TPR) repeat protein
MLLSLKHQCHLLLAIVAAAGLFSAAPVMAADGNSFTNLLAQGESTGLRGDIAGALKIYTSADALAANNSVELCLLTKHYCDLMYDTTAPDLQKTLAQTAFDCAQRALTADPSNAVAHLCVAVGYVKNFPYTNNETKMKWSKAIKTECEIAISLDPKQDIGYYLLGRWNYNTANLGFIYKGLAKLIYGGFPSASNEEAIKNFQKAIELAPNRIIHHHQLAIVYDKTGQKKLALAELEKCSTLNPVDRDDEQAQKEAATLLSSLK